MDGIQPYILPQNSVPSSKPSETLGSILTRAKSSTDAIFVFDDKNNFLGIISPTHCLFKRRFPSGTKVQHGMVNPPRLTKDTTLYDIATQMLSFGVYTLPMFDSKDTIFGVITGKSIIKAVLEDKDLLTQVKKYIEIAKPVVGSARMSVGEAYSILRKEKSSRIIITDHTGKVEGILTRRDIQKAFMSPQKGTRHGNDRTRNGGSINFNEEELTRFDFPVSEFYNTNVVTIEKGATIQEIIECLVENPVNSVVVVDRVNKPIGIVSVRSILNALSGIKPIPSIPIELSDRHHLLTPQELGDVTRALNHFGKKQQKKMPIMNIECVIDESKKNSKGKIVTYHINLFLQLVNGKNYTARVEHERLLSGIKEAIKKIQHQEE